MNRVEQEPQKTIHAGIGGANTKGSRRSVAGSGSNALFGRSDLLPTYSMDGKLANECQYEKK